jgi:hypothetical protein
MRKIKLLLASDERISDSCTLSWAHTSGYQLVELRSCHVQLSRCAMHEDTKTQIGNREQSRKHTRANTAPTDSRPRKTNRTRKIIMGVRAESNQTWWSLIIIPHHPHHLLPARDDRCYHHDDSVIEAAQWKRNKDTDNFS